ncbi:O-antigen ligase family protein [Calditrichota bacterium GD2]
MIFLLLNFLVFYFSFDFIKINSKIVFYTILVVAFIESLIGLLQNYGFNFTGLAHFYKIVGTYTTPTLFVACITHALPVGFALYCLNKNENIKNIVLFTIGLVLLAVLLSGIRAAWLAAFVGIGLFFLLKNLHIVKQWLSQKRIKIITLMAGLTLVAILVMALYYIRPASADARLLIWRISFNMIKDHPIIGIGLGNFAVKYMNYQEEFFKNPANIDIWANVAGNVNHAHNEFLQILVETGIIGLLLFLAFLLFTYQKTFHLIRSNKLNNEDRLIIIGSISAISSILVLSFFGFFLYFPYLTIFFIAYLAIIGSILKKYQKGIIEFYLTRSVHLTFLFIITALFLQIAPKMYKEYKARKIWQEALILALYKQPELAIKKYNQIYDTLKDNGEFLFMFGATYVSIDSCQKGIELLERSKLNYNNPKIYIALGNGYEKSGRFQKAIINYQIAGYMMPHQLYPHYLLAKLYHKIKNDKKAISEAQIVINKPIKIDSPAARQMKAEMHVLLDKLNKDH